MKQFATFTVNAVVVFLAVVVVLTLIGYAGGYVAYSAVEAYQWLGR